MPPITLLYPLFALALWTGIILLLIPLSRVLAARRGQVVIDDFKMGESPSVPDQVRLINRNYMNLLELPMLFYVVCLLIFVAIPVSERMVYLAWAYVGLRVVHSLIHISYNRVFHRLCAFIASNVVLVMLWMLAASSLS
jgi:hypothetical protein